MVATSRINGRRGPSFSVHLDSEGGLHQGRGPRALDSSYQLYRLPQRRARVCRRSERQQNAMVVSKIRNCQCSDCRCVSERVRFSLVPVARNRTELDTSRSIFHEVTQLNSGSIADSLRYSPRSRNFSYRCSRSSSTSRRTTSESCRFK